MTRYRGFVSSTGAFVVVPKENEKSEPFSNRKQVRIFLVWWARVSRRAALLKKPHRGFFARRDASAGPQLFESTREGVTWGFYKRKRPAYFLRWSFGGRGWIRTTEAESSRFTVCPHWPLGNTPIFYCAVIADRLYILPSKMEFVNSFFDFLFRAGLTGRAPFC